MRPHVSYSELGQFHNDCQWRWKLDYLENKRSEKFSIHFDFGTATHEALELHLTRKEPITVDEAVHVFRTRLIELEGEHRRLYEGDEYKLDELLVSGERILRHLNDCEELAKAEVVHNEFPLLEDIGREDGEPIKFKGFIDLVIKTKDKRGNTILYVIDFKTCSWGWNREKREDRWLHYQIFLYKYYLCKKFDIDPKLVRTAFVLLKKKPPKNGSPIEFFPVSAGPVSVQRALNEVGSIVTEMVEKSKTGDFEKNRKSCIDSYGHTCPYYKGTLCPE